MEIFWYGHSCFRLVERGMASIVTDPFDHRVVGYEPLKLRADVVTISHDSPSHNYVDGVKGTSHVITGPGEYEIGGVFITGVQTNHRNGKEDTPRNTLYVFDYNGINVAHLGDLNHVPSQTEVESLGTVHIALVPVGDGSSLNASRAAEVISLLEPNIVIPMHYHTPACNLKLDSLNKFLKEMGLSEIETLPSLKISGTAGLPEETRVIVLDYQH
ncbi:MULTISPECIES: MBL fold metallo-hydrolase [Anaerolinea]|uniref:MBL fold metallo-hydrolase n=1 Tax=Anaerolinea TaxID=233189 RepID=UPI002613038A|nr:MBL fold metallo-hydrolase [Anaerolinea thermophila]